MSGDTFKRVYLIYLAALLALAVAASLYVRSILRGYERAQPQSCAQAAAEELAREAASGRFQETYPLPQAVPGPYEQGLDLPGEYLALYSGGLSVSQKSGQHAEDELSFQVENGGFVLAELELKASGPPETRLGILTSRPWEVVSVEPVFRPQDYTLTVPASFGVRVNGRALTASDGAEAPNGQIQYTVPGLYLKPVFEISDPSGALASYRLKNGKVLPELYNYSLTIPASLTVTVDGQTDPGTALEDGMVRHDIVRLAKPSVQISDRFGGTVAYEGGDRFPLTYMTIRAREDDTVRAEGQVLRPDSTAPDPDFARFAGYLRNAPQISLYDVAILKEGAEVSVTDGAGRPVALEPGLHTYDLVQAGGLDAVPADVAAEVDVTGIAQKWSLMMSNDLRFSQISPHLIKGSYQYEVASKYANGIDITFTSSHTLKDPAFTDVSASNFHWIGDNGFSVDIRFVKHMLLGRTGMSVDDPMNDRFYFVKYDNAWKLAGMKEIVDDG